MSTTHQDPTSAGDFVNINTPPSLTKPSSSNNNNNNIDADTSATKLIEQISTSVQSIKEIASTLATKKSSAKPFLECVEELLADLKERKDTIEDEYVVPKNEKYVEAKVQFEDFVNL